MNLKQEIDRNGNNKDAVKIAKNKINEEIISGGGTKANTLFEVPDRIKKVLGKYKKTAYFYLNIHMYTLKENEPLEVEKKTNTSFKPSKMFINFLDNTGLHNFVFTNALRINEIENNGFNVNYNYFKITIKEITKEKIILVFTPENIQDYLGFSFTLDEVYLIE